MSSQEDTIVCLDCNHQTTEELSGSTLTQLGACPNCGSKHLHHIVTARYSFSAESLKGVTSTATAYFDVIAYSRILLNEAQNLINAGQFDMAVVISHAACEIAMEQVLSNAIANKDIRYLEEWLSEFLGKPTNERAQRLLTVLTGKEIQGQQPLWREFKKSWNRRNDIVHRGVRVVKDEAEHSLKFCTDLVNYLKK